jgi:hypothetical protein
VTDENAAYLEDEIWAAFAAISSFHPDGPCRCGQESPAEVCRCHNRIGLTPEQHENDCPLAQLVEPDQPDTCERVHVDIVTEHDVMYSVAEIRAAVESEGFDGANWLIAALRQRRAEQ